MPRIAQIVAASGFVQAVVRPAGPILAPAGMTFVEIEDSEPDPCGFYYVNGAFQEEAP